MKTLILGLGNPILTDDGVGIQVARQVAETLGEREDVTVTEASIGGLRVMELATGYERLILVDAILTENGLPGTLYRLTLEAFCVSLHSGCSHDVDLFTALELGRSLGLAMPREVVIIAIEAEDVLTFGERCTPAVEAAIPEAVEMVLAEIQQS